MRICGRSSRSSEARKSGRSRTRVARELVDAALLAVDDADRVRHPQARLAQRLDRLDRRAAGGDDVLDEADALARAR